VALLPAEVALDDPPADCEALPPLHVLKTQTGALAFAGAFADAAGSTVALAT